MPPLESLLVSIDVAPRAEKLELTHTVSALHERAKLDGLADSKEYLKLAILVAFRRHHHLKAMPSGTGVGEWCVLLWAAPTLTWYKRCCLWCRTSGLLAMRVWSGMMLMLIVLHLALNPLKVQVLQLLQSWSTQEALQEVQPACSLQLLPCSRGN